MPCLGGTTGEGCVAGVDSLQSGLISYTASPADVSGSGFVLATVNYTGGMAHDTVANTPGVAASNQKSTPVVACTVSTTTGRADVLDDHDAAAERLARRSSW